MATVCDDISEFLDALKDMRIVDDKVVYALNNSIPTASFSNKVDTQSTCRDLFNQLVSSHSNRENVLKNCLDVTVHRVNRLKDERTKNMDDIQLLKRLRKEQTKLRELQTQMNVEEVIRGRTLKIYNERCRAFYRPPKDQLEQ